ncbi:MAG: branched-chain amino acid ABC transporter ATP-binding protein/permease [SAR324 cluster bacterium]|jgi:branched-chain amino acid transport system permease protein|nr:branched-chain amino acid ABC transporter ATP-binding protein/permease [SAR324 cluster bacterium]MDP7045916.1 branched-chain amino acid ABC transporter ATP-binding protein/permease [SAR324 cluster bacterium]MDP7582934.1 branched-chain amino acid ABC transporter ATP-binding protein/permease [SAR324 cluster bacterium]|tara:strand:- start:6020 stop:7882 length:1863 start_codon:yes stop_codon:yes gene_type:complete
MRNDSVRHIVLPTFGSIILIVVLIFGGILYSANGDASRDSLITQMLINAIIVLGIQIYVGNTGVLSFGHIGFGAIAGYTFAVCAISPARKMMQIPDAPFGLADVDLTPLQSGMIAVALTVALAFFIGLALSRSGARSGAVSAVVITLALLFVVHEVAKNWTDLTRGGKIGLSFSPFGNATLEGKNWIYVLLISAALLARLFKETRIGRFTQCAREDDLAARTMGIDPAIQQMAALIISVALVSAGSALRVFELGSINPRLFFFDYTLLTLTMLIVGGRNGITGALAGVVIITIGSELTRKLSELDIEALSWILREGLTDLFLGGAMLGFMILRPAGVLGDLEFDHWLHERFRHRQKKKSWTSKEGQIRSIVVKKNQTVLNVEGVSVNFGGFRALGNVELKATGDEIVGLIGPNGAGKTTLLNVITGLVEPDSGRVHLGEKNLTGMQPHEIARSGLVRTFQNFRLFSDLSVRENIEAVHLMAGQYRSTQTLPDVDALLFQAGLWKFQSLRAAALDYGNARRLELARAVAAAPDFLLLDEPTSGMDDNESIAMIDQVRTMSSMVGSGVVVIDHDLNFITGICDRVYVLDQGCVIASGTPAEISSDPAVKAAYLGATAEPACK